MAEVLRWSDQLRSEQLSWSNDERLRTLYIERHPKYPAYLLVNSGDPLYMHKFKDVLNEYRSIPLLRLNKLIDKANEEKFDRLIFMNDPDELFGFLTSLEESYPFDLNFELKRFQLRGFNYTKDLSSAIINWSTGPQPLSAKMLTPNGWTTMGEIKIGDIITGSNGKEQVINGVFPQGIKEAYQVTFSDGSKTICSLDHLWMLQHWSHCPRIYESERQRYGRRSFTRAGKREFKLMSLSEIQEDLFVKSGQKASPNGRAKWSLPDAPCIHFNSTEELPLHPYLLGVMLGDGSMRGSVLTSADPEIPELLRRECGVRVRKRATKYTYGVLGIRSALIDLGLISTRSWDKFIPKQYLRSNPESRLALLQGLLDTDGCAGGSGASFTSTSKQLAYDVMELARSLGMISTTPRSRHTYCNGKAGRESFRIQISSTETLFRLARKQEKIKPFKNAYRRLVSIEKIGTIEMQCISVSNEDGLYITDDFIITHNTGKAIYSVARAKYLLERGEIDKVVIISKSHNKINWQRTLLEKGGLHSVRDAEAKGSNPQQLREARVKIYRDEIIFIINYEKLRFRDKPNLARDSMGRKRPDSSGDGQELLDALKNKKVLLVWDEMPAKMKSMSTGWYRGAEKILRKTKKNYQIELTATKLDTNPENVYSCVKLLDKTIWPSVAVFRQQYAKRMSAFSPWQVASWDTKKLPELGMRLAHMTHIANKYTDPEIRAEFPEDHWEDVLIDMSDQDRRLYNYIENGIIQDLAGDYQSVLAKILPLQLICDNPDLINWSQGKMSTFLQTQYSFSDRYCAKLETLRSMIDEIDGKIVLFSMFHDLGSKMLARYMTDWKVPFVLYSGNDQQKQLAQDTFRSNPKIKVFISSDIGSDSIDLEQATTVINYNLPWNYSTLVQRVNRISRLTSEADHVFYYNLITADTLEERKLKILERKRKLEEAIDSDLVQHSELITHSSTNELRWIITGELESVK